MSGVGLWREAVVRDTASRSADNADLCRCSFRLRRNRSWMQHAFRCDAASVTKAVVGRAAGSQIETLFLLRGGGTNRERTFLTFAVGARTYATVKRHSFPADRRSPRAIRSLKVTALPRIVVTGRSLLSMIYAISMAQGIEPGPKRADCAEGTGRAPSGTHCQSRATAHDACKHRPIAPRQRIGGCFLSCHRPRLQNGYRLEPAENPT